MLGGEGTWIGVPAIGKWVSVALAGTVRAGHEAIGCALSLPELRQFALAAAALGVDVTAPAGEWTSTCVRRSFSPGSAEPVDEVVHHAVLERRGSTWAVTGGSVVRMVLLPKSGWAVVQPGRRWWNAETGLPVATVDDLDTAHSTLASGTGYSYFWEPENDGVAAVIRECERLQGDVMDICATLSPDVAHPDIRTREWLAMRPAEIGVGRPVVSAGRPR